MAVNVKIGFSSGSRLSSRIIKFFTRSHISHAFLIIEDSFLGSDMVMEATPGGFRLITLSQFARTHDIVAVFDIPHSLEKGVRKSASWLGRKYDYLGVFGTAFVLLGRWMKLKWANPFNTKAIYCSEAIVYILQVSNYPGALELDPASTTPADLYSFLKKSSG